MKFCLKIFKDYYLFCSISFPFAQKFCLCICGSGDNYCSSQVHIILSLLAIVLLLIQVLESLWPSSPYERDLFICLCHRADPPPSWLGVVASQYSSWEFSLVLMQMKVTMIPLLAQCLPCTFKCGQISLWSSILYPFSRESSRIFFLGDYLSSIVQCKIFVVPQTSSLGPGKSLVLSWPWGPCAL